MYQSGGEHDTANLYLNRDEKSFGCVEKERHFIVSVGPLSVTVPASHLNEDESGSTDPVLCIPHSSLVEALHLYSPGGVLTVVVTLHSAVEVVPTPTVAVPPSSLAIASDLYRLLESGTGSYTTLVCGGSKRFPVHSDILCARSPVFAAQMRWPMLASPITELQVDGFEAPILGRLLQFVYTDELEPLPYAEEAMHLLNAASFYNLPRLLAICESVLVDSLAVDNVALVLTLAEQHGVQTLKQEALRFFAANVPGVIATEGWAHLNQERDAGAGRTGRPSLHSMRSTDRRSSLLRCIITFAEA